MSYDEKSGYYSAGGIETIDIIRAKLTPDQFEGYLLGNVIKYACRLEHKKQKERDITKLKNYTTWLNDWQRKEKAKPTYDDEPIYRKLHHNKRLTAEAAERKKEL